MNDIAASERRLSAALDRMDQLIESRTSRRSEKPVPDQSLQAALESARAENQRLQAEVASLRAAGSGEHKALEAEISVLREKYRAQAVPVAELMTELERLLDESETPADSAQMLTTEAVGDDVGLPEADQQTVGANADAAARSPFSAVYDDESDAENQEEAS